MSETTEITRADICVVACAEAFRGDGEIMASPMGSVPTLGARLARGSFEPALVLTDGVSSIIANNQPVGKSDTPPVVEGWMPYRLVFDVVWSGKRHVMMGATQIDQFGNQNIANIGPWAQPKVQLLGARGAPGNTINHQTSYFVGNQTAKCFVPEVDMVSGVGTNRAASLSEASRRFHEIRRVISNLAVYDFENPEGRMQLRSIHPGVSLEEVQDNTGFDLIVPENPPETRQPTAEELVLLRTLDPNGLAAREVVVPAA